jgi:DNA topoisomerase I
LPKPLVIVESPAKARTIAGFLGDDFEVKASIGHIRDLPRNADEVPAEYKGTEAGRLGIDVGNHFQPIYVVSPDKKKVVAELKRALKGASELYLATDEDREGEAISWHVLEVLKPRVPVKRMVFHEITAPAIHEAIDNWRDLDLKLVEAQEGRRVLDRLVGYEISPVLWKKVMPKLSAGRVQSVAARLVVERERGRMAFRAADYWDLAGTFSAHEIAFGADLVTLAGTRVATGRDFDSATGQLSGPADAVRLGEAEAAQLAERLRDVPFRVQSVESKAFTERPKPPFTTSTLQQEAARKLRFGAARTMQIAQRLYENGYITYMRTDSTNLSEQAVAAARAQIHELYGDDYLPAKPRRWKGKVKNAQEAHEAIRPAGERLSTPEQLKRELDGDDFKLYELVWMRTIACQMADARARRVSLRLVATSTAAEEAVFAASGKTYEFVGFRLAYVEGADDPAAELDDAERPLPAVAEGEAVSCEELAASGHTTQPPARFTEASLVKELEERGIGRPSTYASVIQTIQDRGYVWKKGTALVPSWTGFATVRLLEQHFSDLVDYEFTARMEEDLDVIARNEAESEKWLHGFYFGNGHAGLKKMVEGEHLDRIDAREVNTIPLGADAEGREIAVRVGRYGPYLERGDDRASLADDLPPDELTVELAVELLARSDNGRLVGVDPETGLDVMARDGRYGPYVQLGESDNGSKDKPRTASLLKSMEIASVSLDDALMLLSLPRVVGADGDGTEITARNGRYGPYLTKGKETRSLETEEQLFTVTLTEAEALFALPKPRRGRHTKAPLAELGLHPDSGAPVRVLDGRFGPYATDGTTNASLPRGTDPAELTLAEAVTLLRARAELGPRRKPAKKPAKKTAKKAVKKTAKRTAKVAKKVVKKAAKKAIAAPERAAGSGRP